MLVAVSVFGEYEHAYQNPDLPLEERVNDFVSLMTLKEKVAFLSSRPGLPRLGLRPMGQMEGLHGLATGGPGGWNRPNVVPTTIFPQSIGLGATWDPDLLHQAGAIEGYEAHYVLQSPKYGRAALVIGESECRSWARHPLGTQRGMLRRRSVPKRNRWPLPWSRDFKAIVAIGKPARFPDMSKARSSALTAGANPPARIEGPQMK